MWFGSLIIIIGLVLGKGDYISIGLAAIGLRERTYRKPNRG